MIKEDDPYEGLKNRSWKELRDTVEELEDELFKAEQDAKKAEELMAMVSYIATNYAIYVMSTDEENKGGKEELLCLRDNIIKEAYDKFSK